MAKQSSTTTTSILKQAQEKQEAAKLAAEQAAASVEPEADVPATDPVVEETATQDVVETTETPATPEVEPEVTTPAPAAKVVAAPAVVAAVVDPKVKTITGYIENYLKVNTGHLDTKEQKAAAISTFRQITNYGMKNPTPAVLDVIVDFFRKNKDRVLSEYVALQGLYDPGRYPESERQKISMFYGLMRIVTTEKRTELKRFVVLDRVREVFKSDDLVNYLSDRFGL